MIRPYLLVSALIGAIVMLAAGPEAAAQSFLERLEQRLGEAVGGQNADAPATPATNQDEIGTPGYLGLVADESDPPGQGVRVLTVYEGGPAARAGFREGDLIMAVDRRGVSSVDQMGSMLQNVRVGQRVEFTVQRDGRREVLRAVLSDRALPGRDESRRRAPFDDQEYPPEPPRAPATPDRPSLGITVGEVGEAARDRYGLTVDRGAVITSIRPGSPADRAGLPLGGVIVEVDRQRVDNVNDLLDVLAEEEVGQTVELSYYAGTQLLQRDVQLTAAPRTADRVPPPGPGVPPRLSDDRGSRRPVLEGIGRVIDELADQPRSSADAVEIEQQRMTIRRLQEQLEQMQQRIDQLERRLGDLETPE